MSGLQHSAQAEEPDEFWTLDGLAAWFGISTGQIRRYIEWGLVDHAIGKFPHGLNYTATHVTQIAAVRESLGKIGHHVSLRSRARRPHVVVVARREQVA